MNGTWEEQGGLLAKKTDGSSWTREKKEKAGFTKLNFFSLINNSYFLDKSLPSLLDIFFLFYWMVIIMCFVIIGRIARYFYFSLWYCY